MIVFFSPFGKFISKSLQKILLASFRELRTEIHLVQGTNLLYVACDRKAAEFLLMKVMLPTSKAYQV